ncbi:MAG TPA: hypothetical protein VND54_07685 [Candidatus Saccharimonadales bacterium]|nr:hypothetical protein [Candidatus Saccharimonadales bacterium]
MTTTVSKASPKKSGRPRDAITRLALLEIVESVSPCTVRQAFYQATVRDVVPKTEAGYDKVGRLLVEMRLDGSLPWEWITDNMRWMRKPRTYGSLEDAATWWAAGYRRDLVPALGRVEIWLEKDALAGVIYPVTEEWDVPLMVTRGYSSLSFLHTAAESWRMDWRNEDAEPEDPVTVYYLGDHDPSGRDIDRNIERRLREFAPDTRLRFKRIAVTEEQITEWSLPGRPTKRSDTRSHSWVGDSVELDAIPPDRLRDLVRRRLEAHVNPDTLARIRSAEAAERESIRDFARQVLSA